MIRAAVVASGLLSCWAPAWGQIAVDEFVIAPKGVRVGESTRIRGNAVTWQRCWGDDSRLKDTIQFKDLSHLDLPAVDVAFYPCNRGPIILGPTHLFWEDWDRGQVFARAVEDLGEGLEGENVVVGLPVPVDRVAIMAASADHVFVRTWDELDEFHHVRGRILAKEIDRLADPAPETLHEIARYKWSPAAEPDVAVSDEYFVWQDIDTDAGQESWRLYAKRIDDLFVPGAERLVLDTKLLDLNVDIDVHGSVLVFRGSLDPEAVPWGQIYILDLDKPSEPLPVAVAYDPDVIALDACAVSSDYVVWTETRDDPISVLADRAFGRRLEGGVPVGEAFPLSRGAGGSWLAFDRNVAVWNGGQLYTGGGFAYTSVVAAELPLPGATDLGDVDQNGSVNITDAVIILSYLFRGGWRPRLRLADVNSSGSHDIGDAILILQHLFGGAPLH